MTERYRLTPLGLAFLHALDSTCPRCQGLGDRGVRCEVCGNLRRVEAEPQDPDEFDAWIAETRPGGPR